MDLHIKLFSKALTEAIEKRMENISIDYQLMINDQAVDMLNKIYDIILNNPENDTKSILEIIDLFEEIGYRKI